LEKTYAVSLLVEDKAGRRRMVSSQISVGDTTIADVTVDDFDADLFGRWEGEHPSIVLGNNRRTPDIFTGPGIHRDVVMKGKKIAARAKFVPNLPRAGRYEICLGFRPAKDQATNVPIVIHTAEGVKRVTLNERTSDTPFPFVPLGEFKFAAGEHSYLKPMAISRLTVCDGCGSENRTCVRPIGLARSEPSSHSPRVQRP
jgi:hypothetical protein